MDKQTLKITVTILFGMLGGIIGAVASLLFLIFVWGPMFPNSTFDGSTLIGLVGICSAGIAGHLVYTSMFNG